MPQTTKYPRRLTELRSLMHPDFDALLLLNPQNVRYYCGFAGDESWLLVTQNELFLLSDGRFIAQAAAEAPLAEFLCRTTEQDVFHLLLAACARCGSKRLGFEGSRLSYQDWETLTRRMKNNRLHMTVGDCGTLADTPRLIKDAGEIACLRECGRIEDRALEAILPLIRPGMTEKELAWRLESAMREYGGEGVSFPTIVASGENSAKPHAIPSDRSFTRGDFVTIDFGCLYRGYCGDCTRTFAVGRPSNEQLAAYQLVLDAQMQAMATVKPGMTTGRADAIARDIISAAGMGEYFSHSLGHGVGLEIHEAPAVRRGGGDIITPGNVITIEPGIYIPSRFGLRIEDSCLITPDGAEPLTGFTKELLILGDQ